MNWEQLEAMAIPEPNSGCLLWNERREIRGGYGVVQENKKRTMAHRMAYELVRGPVPAGLLVCHKCDITACINPDHLFLGTSKDNTADMFRKGRGHLPTTAILTKREVLEIFNSSKRYADLAKEFNTTVSGVSQIKRGTRWAEITGQKYEEKTHCAQGHPWIAENIITSAKRGSRCRECSRIACSNYYARKKSCAV